ncbi:MAG: NAD(P)/FAD-dependent oxidoreductase [Defluviitaleaceae bacterium]|nr:NAD(P)/FAD-dependent oxidoreductase [Defluviitaleaceae bacterium]
MSSHTHVLSGRCRFSVSVLIVGGGPAGVTAAIYTARAGLNTTIIYKDFGALEKAHVENYYGFSKISGKSLVEKGLRQARKFGTKTIRDEVVNIKSDLIVETASKSYEARAILLATGTSRKSLAGQLSSLEKFEGRGVSYCAICDGFFYRGKDVAVLGSGAYALHEVNDLLPLVSSVTLLTNGDEPTVTFPDSVLIRKEKIMTLYSSMSTGLIKTENFQGVILENQEKIPLSGLFVALGTAGGTALARKLGAEVIANAIKTDDQKRTTIPGIWAAGDCIGGIAQIAKAVHDGAEAGLSIVKTLRTK